MNETLSITKSSGEKVDFSFDILKHSLRKSGAEEKIITQILNTVQDELYDGITTEEIYERAYNMLRQFKSSCAARYKLKRAIYELGPTGFPFEIFIAEILRYSGYKVEVSKILQGACVSHEVDVVARKNDHVYLIECKYHSLKGAKCDVKVPLYIHSRFEDIRKKMSNGEQAAASHQGWVVTNTRFTQDAVTYGRCAGLYLLSWDLPEGDALKDRIDRLGLHPITTSTLLSAREKQYLLDKKVVMVQQLLSEPFWLDQLRVGERRKERIMDEFRQLSKHGS